MATQWARSPRAGDSVQVLQAVPQEVVGRGPDRVWTVLTSMSVIDLWSTGFLGNLGKGLWKSVTGATD